MPQHKLPTVLLLQEAQLSQTDRSMIRVIADFAKSLKVTQGHSKSHSWEAHKSIVVFHIVCIWHSFWDIQR